MGEYYCDCCGRRLCDSEVNVAWDDRLDEIYVSCKCCGSECFDYNEEEEEEEDDCED